MDDWRRIDIDQYDPEAQYEADDLNLPAYTLQDIEPKLSELRTQLSRGSAIQALKLGLDDPPYGSAPNVKSAYLLSVLEILQTIKQSEISGLVKELDLDEIDVLVKFLYSLMALKEGQKSGGVLLTWFDKAIEIVGEGPIVRYMSDELKMMAVIKRGDKFPNNVKNLYYKPEGGEPKEFDLKSFTRGKKYVVVNVPGAFTPPCSEQHLPGYIKSVQQFASKGVDFILVVSKNDPLVLNAWRQSLGVNSPKIIFVSDPELELTKKLGSTLDLSEIGLGLRTGRLALIVNRSGIVEFAAVEDGGAVDVSTAPKLLAKL
ncbi:hypothetical protein CANARDRAFT_229983 [[Candida] arabinofermentans NRRL YB-2248]|uniref:Actin-related protein 2/3 complex subunit 5 n=1 Tax=[Candida] arabinofermentans NRRL YB-2248 TaxID=983967 RepID=A0A1E4T6T9_9ASCO|nr:hypothetical protein CANARDRAFT_229983 [[Candida] arabinofermentans NRRL YB-2248]